MYADAVVHSQTSQGNQKNSVFILHRKHSSEKKKVTWVVTKLLESSAQAKLEQLILAEQWEAALLLSDAHNLDKDLVRRYVFQLQIKGLVDFIMLPGNKFAPCQDFCN